MPANVSACASRTPRAKPSIERVIEFLLRELDGSNGDVAAHIQRHHAELAAALQSESGIDAASVVVLLAKLPSWASSTAAMSLGS